MWPTTAAYDVAHRATVHAHHTPNPPTGMPDTYIEGSGRCDAERGAGHGLSPSDDKSVHEQQSIHVRQIPKVENTATSPAPPRGSPPPHDTAVINVGT
jgi:hypothetical protein